MIREIVTIAASLLYLHFILSGLSYIFLAYDLQFFREIFALIPLGDWTASVYLLCLAHILHAISVFGWLFACQYTFFGLGIVALMEEVGLRTDIIFGRYHFTSHLGSYITPNLPLLVPFLWFSLSYPLFVYTFIMLEKRRWSKIRHQTYRVILSAVLLTAYDLVSDPVGVLYGNKIWYHAAHVDSVSSLDTYVPKPDWVFTGRSGSSASDFAQLSVLRKLKDTALDFLSFPCHFDIPLHV